MAENAEGQQSCKACGTPAGEGELCEHCGKVLELSDRRGVVEDEGPLRGVFLKAGTARRYKCRPRHLC